LSPEELEAAIQDVINVLAFERPLKFPNEMIATFAAFGWPEGHETLCRQARQLTLEGKPLPFDLQQYIVAVACSSKPRKGRGGDRFANFARDIRIKTALRRLEAGIQATRNPATTDRECGCSIVRMALERGGIHLTEKAIAKVWEARGPVVRNE
jgi:hypothetical protein